MIEEVEDHRSPIPNVRMIRQITVPRWAVNEPEPGEEYVMPEVPDLGEAENVFFRSQYKLEPAQLYVGSLLNVAPISPEGRMIEFNHVESYYNETGLLVDRKEFNEGSLQQRERFLFDAEGRLIRRVLEDHLDEQLEKEEFLYGADGKLLLNTVTYSDRSKQSTMHIWSGLTEDAITSDDEGVVAHVRTTFDEKEHVIERVEIEPTSGKSTGSFWEFDDSESLITVGTIDVDGTRWISETLEYDTLGRETAWAESDHQGNTLRERLSTYEDDDCTEIQMIDSNGETVTSQEFNEEHKLLRSQTSGSDEESETINIYDDKGMIFVSASRTLKNSTGGSVLRRPRAYGLASTTWWQYEFFPS